MLGLRVPGGRKALWSPAADMSSGRFDASSRRGRQNEGLMRWKAGG